MCGKKKNILASLLVVFFCFQAHTSVYALWGSKSKKSKTKSSSKTKNSKKTSSSSSSKSKSKSSWFGSKKSTRTSPNKTEKYNKAAEDATKKADDARKKAENVQAKALDAAKKAEEAAKSNDEKVRKKAEAAAKKAAKEAEKAAKSAESAAKKARSAAKKATGNVKMKAEEAAKKAESAAKKAKDEVKKAKKKFEAEFKKAKDRAKKELAKVKEKAKEGVEKTKGKAKSFWDKMKDKASAAAAKAKEKGKELAAKAKEKLEEAKEKLEIIKDGVIAALKTIGEQLKERIEELSFEESDSLDLMFTINLGEEGDVEEDEDEDEEEDSKRSRRRRSRRSRSREPEEAKEFTFGIKYEFEPGPGEVDQPFEEIKGTFYPESFSVGPLPVPIADLIKKVPGSAKEMVKKIEVLPPEVVFFVKVIALANDAKSIKEDEGAGAAAAFFASNLGLLLGRLSITPGFENPEDLLEKLPDPVEELIDKLKLPISDQDLQEYEDRANKEPSEMQMLVSTMRYEFGYDNRTEVAENMIDLLDEKLNASDKVLFVYAMRHQAYDLDQGFLPDDEEDFKKEEIEFRAEYFQEVLEDIVEKTQENKMFEKKEQEELEKLLEIVKEAKKTGKKDEMEKPELWRAGVKDKRVEVPVPKFLNIKWDSFKHDIFERKFEIDGYYHLEDEDERGEYLYDDSYLSKNKTLKYITALLFKCLRSKDDEDFDLKGFFQSILKNC